MSPHDPATHEDGTMTPTAPGTADPALQPDDVRTVGAPLDGHVPDVPAEQAWDDRRLHYDLVAPANRRKFTVIVVGTGLAGSGAAAALGELGYQVECFTIHDAPRRAHSVAAQGGINAARARKVDNDSVHRFVKDTVNLQAWWAIGTKSSGEVVSADAF